MTGPILSFCLCFALNGAPPPPDRWFAEDKLRHFAVSFAATALAGSAARAAGAEARAAAWIGAGAGATVGVLKELRDLRAEGATASGRDLVWDAAGITAATAALLQAR